MSESGPSMRVHQNCADLIMLLLTVDLKKTLGIRLGLEFCASRCISSVQSDLWIPRLAGLLKMDLAHCRRLLCF